MTPWNAGVTLDAWTGLNSGDAITDLRQGTNQLINAPNKSVRQLDKLIGLYNDGDKYGTRISGWLVSEACKDCQFFLYSDNAGEFWLSATDSPADKVLICNNLSATKRYHPCVSDYIHLDSGQAYYYEVSKNVRADILIKYCPHSSDLVV